MGNTSIDCGEGVGVVQSELQTEEVVVSPLQLHIVEDLRVQEDLLVGRGWGGAKEGRF